MGRVKIKVVKQGVGVLYKRQNYAANFLPHSLLMVCTQRGTASRRCVFLVICTVSVWFGSIQLGLLLEVTEENLFFVKYLTN